MKYNKDAPTYYKIQCSECKKEREIYRRDGTADDAKFYCKHCKKMVKQLLK